MINRRNILKTMGLGAVAASIPGISFAKTNGDSRLVMIVLRGAVDGLALVAPYGDSKYQSIRGELAIPSPGHDGGLLKLDGTFGLHPSMTSTYELYQNNQLLPVHAIASPYRERSHFDGQDVLENGVAHAGDKRDGWLNRALAPLGGGLGDETAIALSQNTPLLLRGDNSVTSWAPSKLPDADDDTLRRIASLYSTDAFFSMRLEQALASQEVAGEMSGMGGRMRQNDRAQSKALAQAAARFLRAPEGPRIAVLEAGGWDTHANQGAANGSLANKFSALDEGIAELRRELGPVWDQTVVMVVTEFGRTVKVNGTRGTDHGTATAALLMGGAVNGGKVMSDWPGLSSRDLYEGRDLYPTMDVRSLFKGVLEEHLLLPDNFVERVVFPDSAGARPVRDIIRA
jgi:uncharacterized protein (DUF1501 family)